MSRETSPYVVGEYWLDKRRDGRSPHIWQIARKAANTIIYRSTHSRELIAAKEAINTFFEMERAKSPHSADDALILPQLSLYWQERGSKAISPAQIASSLRMWYGFLQQKPETLNITVASLSPDVIEGFKQWRMGAHSCTVVWGGKTFTHTSTGVTGETVQRNLEDFRSALNYAHRMRRIPYAPPIDMVRQEDRSAPRDVTVTLEALGAMMAYAEKSRPLYQWLALMIGTACRPDAALAFDPASQYHGKTIDMHPEDKPRTKKRNPVVPCIAPLKPILDAWESGKAGSRKTAWRTMRRVLNLPANVVPKTIRHTIASELRMRGVSMEQIEMLLGHRIGNKTTEVYAKYAPALLADAALVLTIIFSEVLAHAERWKSDHILTTNSHGAKIIVDTTAPNADIT